MLPAGTAIQPTPEAEAFVRFCYQRRRVGWPELYDEMCAVAMRGLFQGMGADALSEIGVGFSLFETPRLAALVTRVADEDQAARRAARAVIREEAIRQAADHEAARAREAADGEADGTREAAVPRVAAVNGDAERRDDARPPMRAGTAAA